MTDLNIYTKYKVDYKIEYCYTNEYGDMSERTDNWTKEMDGWELVKMIANCLNSRDFSDARIDGNEIYSSDFDPNSGETSEVWIKFEPIENKINGNLDEEE